MLLATSAFSFFSVSAWRLNEAVLRWACAVAGAAGQEAEQHEDAKKEAPEHLNTEEAKGKVRAEPGNLQMRLSTA